MDETVGPDIVGPEEEGPGYNGGLLAAEGVSDDAFLEVVVVQFPADNIATDEFDAADDFEDRLSEDDDPESITEVDIEGKTSKSNFSKFSGFGL